MLCARVLRGISSTDKAVTPLDAISRMVSIEPSGRKNPISTWPLRYSGTSALPVLSFEP